MVEKRTCDYSGKEIESGTGTMYVKIDGTVPHFRNSKAKKNYFLGRETRDLEWTEAGRHAGDKAEDNQTSDTGRAFVMIKPDDVQRGLIGDIVSRFEDRDLKMVTDKLVQIDEELAHDHYDEHEGKLFFEGLVGFIASGPVFAMVREGQDATRQVRRMIGETGPAGSALGTIRSNYGLDLGRNVVRGSGREDEGTNEREITLFFDEDGLVDYERVDETWLYE